MRTLNLAMKYKYVHQLRPWSVYLSISVDQIVRINLNYGQYREDQTLYLLGKHKFSFLSD